ncbi:hypothetical protein Tco_0116936 [Tanacetum coccineum]|uniref:Uncharacterized protein n=1 Tax=Tanacetum coccineum TaxID=301880 RepID=A0ABQ5HLI1_9ASTR
MVPESSPMDVYDYFFHGLIDTLYINGDNHKELQEFPSKVQGVIKGYNDLFTKRRELYLKMHSSYPISDKEQKLLVPSMIVAQLGVSNKDYPTRDEIEHVTPTLDQLAFSLAEAFTGSSKIGPETET